MNLVSISFPLWCLKSQDPRCKTQTASLRLIDDYDFDRRAIYCSKARLYERVAVGRKYPCSRPL